MARTYTFAEVERMTRAIERQQSCFDTGGRTGIPEWNQRYLQTYIAAGISPDDLERELQAKIDEYWSTRQKPEDHPSLRPL